MKKLLLLATCCTALSISACSQEKPLRKAAGNAPASSLTLAQGGKTAYVIALASDAIPAEKTAAAQLQKYLGQVTGAAFEVKNEGEVAAAAPQILVGAGSRVKALLPLQKWAALGQDGIVIKSSGNKLILAGGRNRGSLYAVYEFLESSAGCRFWTPTENTIPRKPLLQVKPQNTVYVPALKYREHFTATVRENPEFATKMRENGHFQPQTAEWGGHYSILGWCHTFGTLLPPEQYFKVHPEWYPDPLNSYRPCTAASKMPHGDETQLCLSSPSAVDEIAKQALIWIRKNPEAGYISISQNDNAQAFCNCLVCAKLTEQEGGPAGPLVKFVNEVAAKIAVEYPDFQVETLAYQRTETAPKTIRPAKNVVIRFAPIENNFGYPLDSPQNKTSLANLESWSKISSQLFIWNYITNFNAHWMPHPNWTGLGKDIRTFTANKATGIFEQGDTYSHGVGDLVQLRTWIVSKLMWNPAFDQDKLMAEFMTGYYGKAAPFLQSYLNTVEASLLKQNRILRQDNDDFSYLTLDTMNQSTGLFQKAEAAVKGDKVLLDRVQRERLLLDLAWVYRYKQLKDEAASTGKPFLGPADPLVALKQFQADTLAHGETNFNPGGAFYAALIPRLEDRFAPATALPYFARGLPAQDVIDIQQGNFYLYRKGELSDIVADPNASDGKTASLVGDTNAWAVQATLSKVFEGNAKAKWQVYAYVRVATKAGAAITGDAFANGIYDGEHKKAVLETTTQLAQVAGDKYQSLDFGVHELTGKMYVWFAPSMNPAVDRIFVDRVILVRQK